MIKHKHHIIPRHAGGTDDANNLIELTVSEHAEAHRLLYETYGRKEDEVAWKCLSGIMSKEELVKDLQMIGAKKGGKLGGAIGGKKGKGRKQTPEWIEKRIQLGKNNPMFGKQLTPEQKKKQGDSVRKAIAKSEKWQGTENLLKSIEERKSKGMLPSQQKWNCVCGKSGQGISNFNRWHGKCKK